MDDKEIEKNLSEKESRVVAKKSYKYASTLFISDEKLLHAYSRNFYISRPFLTTFFYRNNDMKQHYIYQIIGGMKNRVRFSNLLSFIFIYES